MQGYLVTVEGDFYGTPTRSDRKKDKFPYKVQVKVPKPEGALSLIKNKLLDKVIRRNYGNYHTYRTHQITSITQLDGGKVHGLTDPRLMDFNDLAVYVKQNKLPLKLELYTDLDYFRTMVYLAETNQRAFLVKQIQLEKDFAEDKALAELNPELSKPLETSERLTATDSVKREQEFYKRKEQSTTQDKTTIIHGEQPKVEGDQELGEVLSAPSSNMITEGGLPAQKVQKVYIEGKGYVDSKDFKENFDREDEAPYETYDPTNGIGAPSETPQVASETANVDEL